MNIASDATKLQFLLVEYYDLSCRMLGRKQHQMKIAKWNVRTHLDREAADRPERRTSLVSMVLAKYNIDIAVLSETRFSESGSLNDLYYTFNWSGIPKGERREAGVEFAIKMEIMTNLTKCHNQ